MKINKRFKFLYTALLATALTACGGGTTEKIPQVVAPVPEVPVQASAIEITLDEALTDLNLDKSTYYSVTLGDDAENLVISLAKGFKKTTMGDPDIYVKYLDDASKDNFDCVSYNGQDQNETCIINKPKAGRYSIYVDVAANSQINDATLWSSITLLTANRECNDALTIRAQSMTSTELDTACNNINEAQQAFVDLFADISPAPETPVDGDLNESTNMTVFSSLSNHTRWIEYLFNDTNNRSGIFYEGSPTQWYHDANIVTFNPIEWTDGYSLVRSDNHEFIHALDARYNKAGGYRQGLGWWSEGLAEYLTTTAYEKYKLSLQKDTQGQDYTLTEIFKGFSGNASPYDGGQLAVAFFLEQHPDLVTQLLENSRDGNWDEWDSLLANWAQSYQTEFSNWLITGPQEKFEASAKPLTLNEPALITGRHGFLYSVEVSEPSDSLTIQVHGNHASGYAMDLDLYASKDSVANTTNYQCRSQHLGSDEICTFSNVTAGTYYITLDSNLSWAADYTDTYLSACLGNDCTVTLPERMQVKTVVDFPIPLPQEIIPDANVFASCDAIRPYERTTDSANITITNTTTTVVKLYWINNNTGEPSLTSPYATLAEGESYSADYWSIGDRMLVTDSSNNCLGVAIFVQANNNYQIDSELVKDVESTPVSEIGSCELAAPYTRTSDGASVTITNKTSTPVNIYWVNNSSGDPYLDSAYATLQLDESYSADYWVVGDRIMITDSNNSCLGVADLSSVNNIFEVDSAIIP